MRGYLQLDQLMNCIGYLSRQASFAGLLGVSVRTLQAWESGRRRPAGPARALLMVIQHDIEAYRAAIAAIEIVRRAAAG